ncbi:MAG TPA: chemotaxis protein CheA [Deltaproteobacteria bacterium]|nr:chemotaxis protein CheA [Deltaproteobacteria bacterium]HQB37834.1 chemotaxis protein CheA [Deltaproteobacteria bacterium]
MTEKTSADRAKKDFLAEAEEISEQLANELSDLSEGAESGNLNPELLNSIFRGAHSLKGLSGMFGFSHIAELSHNFENLLDCLRLGKVNPDRMVLDVLSETMELLTELIRCLAVDSRVDHAADISACIASISACLEAGDHPGSRISALSGLGLSERVISSLTEYEEHRLQDNLKKGNHIYSIHASFEMMTFDTDLSALTDRLKLCGEVVSTLPGVGENMETHIDFDILFAAPVPAQDLQELLADANVLVSLLHAGHVSAPSSGQAGGVSVLTDSISELTAETIAMTGDADNTPSSAAAFSEPPASLKSMSRTVRVDIGKLDELMNIVGELVLAHTAIAGVATSMSNDGFSRLAVDLGKAAKGLERKITELQSGVMDIRMVPVGQLYEKMSRIVRKISREQGKKVELSFFGADTELDKLIVEEVSDPMMHIIRNAIDHGIELPEVRKELGKGEQGQIRISSYQRGNHVIIEIADDGNGIDVEKVKARALQKGLVSDVSSVSDRDALDFIFLPGFSTSDDVSDISGRGVGMDVVRNNIAAISGIVDIETSRGKGTCFIITLPITLAIIKVLIISCAGRTYAVPITSVLETLLIRPCDIENVERREVIQLREITLPLLRLNRFLGLQSRETTEGTESYVIVVGSAEKRLGIVVDDLIGQQDIVIKPLGDAFKGFRGIAGAADLGDQRTILVLDVTGILNDTRHNGN